MCKLLAKETERVALAQRFDIPDLVFLGANVTMSRDDPMSITVTGTLEARIKAGEFLDAETIVCDFDTLILDNQEGKGGMSIEDATDFDEEVGADGSIDIGEIVAQYLCMELF